MWREMVLGGFLMLLLTFLGIAKNARLLFARVVFVVSNSEG